MRVAVIGSRNWMYPAAIHRMLALYDATLVVHGGTLSPIDEAAARWANQHKVMQQIFAPDVSDGKEIVWQQYYRMIRSRPQMLLIFQTRATRPLRDAARLAKAVGIPVLVTRG